MAYSIENQIAEYCDEQESICPMCESWMEEKFRNEHNWLECSNELCGHEIDLTPDFE